MVRFASIVDGKGRRQNGFDSSYGFLQHSSMRCQSQDYDEVGFVLSFLTFFLHLFFPD
jgi:hypothetical protein